MFETIKKWFGKKEEPKVEEPRFNYLFIKEMKNGNNVQCIARNWLSAERAHSRIIDLLEEREWFGSESITGEKLVIKSEDVAGVIVENEPFVTEEN